MKGHLWIPSIERYDKAVSELDADYEDDPVSIIPAIMLEARSLLPKLVKGNLGLAAREMVAGDDQKLFHYYRALGFGACATMMICKKAYGSLAFVDEVLNLQLSYGFEGTSPSDYTLESIEYAQQSLRTLGPTAHKWIETRADEMPISEANRSLFIVGAGRGLDNVHVASKMHLIAATMLSKRYI